MIASCRIVSAVLVRLGAVAAIWVAAAMYLTGATRQVPTRDPNSSVEVRIDAGQLRGLPDPTGVLVFRGIPFAAPPVGDGRWQAPKPPHPWPGIRQATSFGARCPQQRGPAGAGPGALASSEDCLFLNVWTTAPNAGGRRPVLVWFHGGGGVGGTGGIPALDGRALAQKGLVVVTVNYRLGLLGYLAHPALSAESPRRVSGNYALLDQIAALQWVQRNIATFGGDRSRVTVGGSSAGARGVATLLVSPLARGLFHRAILQSGTGLDDAVESMAAAEAHGVRVAEMLGVRGTGSDAAAALRALPPATLVSTFAAWRSVIEGPPAPTIARSAVDGWAILDPIDQGRRARTSSWAQPSLQAADCARSNGTRWIGLLAVVEPFDHDPEGPSFTKVTYAFHDAVIALNDANSRPEVQDRAARRR